MKKYTILFFILFVSLTSFSIHKFYIGVFQIDYKIEKKAFQITSRVFIDDMEVALEKKYGKKIYLSTDKEIKEANVYVSNYFAEKFKIEVNNKPQEILFLAKEYEDDVLICYHKINFSEKISEITIMNKILTEQFSEQQNLLHTNINSNKKSLLFTNKNNLEIIKY